jgi:perosamine synthetase
MIPVNTPLLEGNEGKYLQECIETGWISSEGPFIERFESELARYTGRKHAIAVCNGSAALDAAMIALQIGLGDEVIIPTMTIISCAQAVVHVGATPVVVDCDADTWNMTAELVEAAITPRTKAIMAVHIYGLPVDMSPILALAEKHGLYVIEDAAEVIGQEYKMTNGEAKKCGSLGDVSTFSFYPNKHITTGEGGMVLTDDDELAKRCRSARNLFFKSGRRFVHDELGYNLRMTNMQAALGVAQFERIDWAIKRKREIGRLYDELLADHPLLQLPIARTDYADNIYWVYAMVLNDELPFEADEAMSRLGNHQIGTRPFFWCMHEQPVFHKMGMYANTSCPVAERLARRGFYVPSGLALTDDEIQTVAEALHKEIG